MPSGATSDSASHRGEARVVVGARSAVFAPMKDVGLIVLDEEHDAAYKQDADPRYDARTVAAKRAALEGAVAVYGSATPRPESWERLERLELPARIGAPLPHVRLVDLRREAGYPLSAPLLRELGEIAEHGGRAILLLNRRGVAPAVHCRACGHSRRCGSCDVALTLHADGRLHCHHCGFSEQVPTSCPLCGSVELARVGAGTQKLETELARHLPELERIRLDADTTTQPGELRDALARFATSDRAVLIGTQMVAKGHHFPGVRLAAVVDADTGMALPDLRAEERTFQLVTQLAGRSGRDAPGLVLVQTFQPDATPLVFAARHDVAGFMAQELERRRELGYPPYSHLVSLVVSGSEPAGPEHVLREIRARLEGIDAQLLGPAPLLRLRGRHRSQLVAKTQDPRRSRGLPRPSSRRRRPHCGATVSRPWSTSIRSRSDGLSFRLNSLRVRATTTTTSTRRPRARRARARGGRSSRRRSALRASGWRSPRFGSTATPSCGCGRARSWCSTRSCAPGGADDRR